MAPRAAGRWRIVEMDLLDRDAIDLLGPAFIEISTDGTGNFRFIAVEGDIDGRQLERGGSPAVDFSWIGSDDTMTRPDADGPWSRPMARLSATSTSIAAMTQASGQLPSCRPNNPGGRTRFDRP